MHVMTVTNTPLVGSNSYAQKYANVVAEVGEQLPRPSVKGTCSAVRTALYNCTAPAIDVLDVTSCLFRTATADGVQ